MYHHQAGSSFFATTSNEGHLSNSAVDLNFNIHNGGLFYDHHNNNNNSHQLMMINQQQHQQNYVDQNAFFTASPPTNFYGLPEGYNFIGGEVVPANSGSAASAILNDSYPFPVDYGRAITCDDIINQDGYRMAHEERDQIMNCNKNKKSRGMKGKEKGVIKTEKQRRETFSMKYKILESLIPNLTKPDRATIVADAIEYINELVRTVSELKLLVAKKRQVRDDNNNNNNKILLTGEGDDIECDSLSSSMKPTIPGRDRDNIGGPLRSSWLQRRSKDSLVDIRIVEEEVYIKLSQRKSMLNCLVVVPHVLDELQLQLLHLSGGTIGDCRIFILNAKISEGSSVYAGAIAKKLMEAMEQQQQQQNFSF